jgi:hypothetical protein
MIQLLSVSGCLAHQEYSLTMSNRMRWNAICLMSCTFGEPHNSLPEEQK